MSDNNNFSVKETLVKRLLSVKSFITIALTIAFVVMCVCDIPFPEVFIPIYTTVIGFYFGTQSKKP